MSYWELRGLLLFQDVYCIYQYFCSFYCVLILPDNSKFPSFTSVIFQEHSLAITIGLVLKNVARTVAYMTNL